MPAGSGVIPIPHEPKLCSPGTLYVPGMSSFVEFVQVPTDLLITGANKRKDKIAALPRCSVLYLQRCQDDYVLTSYATAFFSARQQSIAAERKPENTYQVDTATG